MRWWYFLLIQGILLSQTINFVDQVPGEFLDDTFNSVGRWIYVAIDITDTDVSLHINPAPRSPSINNFVTQQHLADIVVSDKTTTMTLAAFKKAGTLSTDFDILTILNPLAPPGYQLQLQMLAMRMNLNVYSPDFYRFQAAPLSNQTGVIFNHILYKGEDVKQWLALPQGVIIAQSWDLNQVIQTTTKKPETVSFTITIPYESVVDMQTGVYWMSIFAFMTPYTVGTFENQLAVIDNSVDPALGSILSLVGTIQGNLQNENALFRLSPSEVALLQNNETLLDHQGIDLIKASIKRYNALRPIATTAAQIAQIDSRIAILTATLAQLLIP